MSIYSQSPSFHQLWSLVWTYTRESDVPSVSAAPELVGYNIQIVRNECLFTNQQHDITPTRYTPCIHPPCMHFTLCSLSS